MDGLFVLMAIVIGLVFLDAAAMRVGVDSTEYSNDPHAPAGGITA